jgi:hypothetical protein
VAGCGLLGALAVWLLRIPPLPARVGGAVILACAIVLTSMRDLHGPSLLAGAFIAFVMLRGKTTTVIPEATHEHTARRAGQLP